MGEIYGQLSRLNLHHLATNACQICRRVSIVNGTAHCGVVIDSVWWLLLSSICESTSVRNLFQCYNESSMHYDYCDYDLIISYWRSIVTMALSRVVSAPSDCFLGAVYKYTYLLTTATTSATSITPPPLLRLRRTTFRFWLTGLLFQRSIQVRLRSVKVPGVARFFRSDAVVACKIFFRRQFSKVLLWKTCSV